MNTNPARGMRDFLAGDVRRREFVVSVVKDVYEKYGFEPLETPAVENLETLLGKYGEEGNQLVFKILERGEGAKEGKTDLALRYDLTVPTARVVAQHKNDLPKFYKRYQIQPVWRADRPARGRFREFYQCDVDVFGSKSMLVEAELCQAVTDVLRKLKFDNFTLRLNHREVLREMLTAADISDAQQFDALTAIDKLDKIGADGVLREFEQRNINREAGAKILRLFADLEKSSNEETLTQLEKFIGAASNGVNELRQIISLNQNAPIKVDASLARGLSYYTGAIFEISVPDLAGSLGGGGRYDNLIGMFGSANIPACGFSLGLERIIVVMTEREMFPDYLTRAPADVLVTIWNAETIADSLELANDLRAQGLRVTVYPEPDKLGKQFKYAANLNIAAVAVIGDDERAANAVTIKFLETGEQQTIKRGNLATELSI